MIFHIFFTYPETARKTLEEIDILFDSKIPAWKSGNVQADALETRAQEIGMKGTDFGGNGLDVEKDKESDVRQERV